MRDSMRGVRTVLRQLMEEQTYQRQRDAMHLASACATTMTWVECVARATTPLTRARSLRTAANESTGRRAVIYSVVESGGLICVSLLQVLLLKRLFDGSNASKHRSSPSPRFGTPSWGV
jgi:hypothetical protein